MSGLPQEIEDRFNYSYPYNDATRRTAKISVSELNAENSSLMLGTIEMGYLTLEEA